MTVRLEPMAEHRFPAFAEQSRRGFAAQQVAAGAMTAAEAEAYAAEQLALLLPEGPATPGHHLWTVHVDGDAAEAGHLWLRVREQSTGTEAYLFDIELRPPYRGRGLGREVMRAAEDRARRLGATGMVLNVFGHNTAAMRLYDSLGFVVSSTMMTRRVDGALPAYDGPAVTLEPMTWDEFDGYRAEAEADYAGNVAAAGLLPAEEARAKATEDFARLLPDGLATVDHFFWTARDGDRPVGLLWLHIAPRSDGLHAFGYDFSVREELRRHGYGRAMAHAAYDVCRQRGVVTVGLNVFGFNLGARTLYDQLGFEVTAQQRKKAL